MLRNGSERHSILFSAAAILFVGTALVIAKIVADERERANAVFIAEDPPPIASEAETRRIHLRARAIDGGDLGLHRLRLSPPLGSPLERTIDIFGTDVTLFGAGGARLPLTIEAPGSEPFRTTLAPEESARAAEHVFLLRRAESRVQLRFRAPAGVAVEWTLWSAMRHVRKGEHPPPPETRSGTLAADRPREVLVPDVALDDAVLFDLRAECAAENGGRTTAVVRKEIVRKDLLRVLVFGGDRTPEPLTIERGILDLGQAVFDPPNVMGVVVDPTGRPLTGVLCTLRERFRMHATAFIDRGAGPIAMLDTVARTGPDGRFSFRAGGDFGHESHALAGRVDLYREAGADGVRRRTAIPVRIGEWNVLSLPPGESP